MINKVLSKVFGTKNDRDMKLVWPVVAEINALEDGMKALSDAQLQGKTSEMRQKLSAGSTLDDLLPEAFAVCREASRRVLGMRHYDVQLVGGIVLHRGNIAEMRTGEGKTLVATLPTYLNALSGLGVHIVTVNDYLAKRDCEWMSRLYNWMGLTTGIIVHDLNDRQRQQSYGADITYGTNNEFGFDYLRDNMKFDLKDYVQRPHNFAIVDECDSILIDEARTPLIISGPAEDSTDKYYTIDRIIPSLKKDVDFVMEEKTKTSSLTDEGNTHVEQLLGIDNLYDAAHIDLLHHVYQALKAHHLYRRDVEYMVKDGEVIIVDEFTGRLMPGRRWSDGLHQAIEAKEGVDVKNENQTLATITFQNYFRMYKKLSGMTGTADTEAVEFQKIYKLEVIVIPTNKPMIRNDHEDIVFKTEVAKFKAIAQDIKKRNEIGQPVLVGTVSIEKSERLSDFLKKMDVRHSVLNAKHHEREAEIIAQAGRKGSVTIATNMAGRGTDILLGGNSESLARAVDANPESPEHQAALIKFTEACAKEKQEVLVAGGLCIVGTERHESRRIDNQLRGRAGRQGDPGASQFYLSLEDNLMRIFNGERVQKIMNLLRVPDDEPITDRMVSRSIEGAQKKVEGHNFDIRKHLLEYDDVMNKQRGMIYGLRREILEGKAIANIVKEFMSEVTSHLLDTFADEGQKVDQWDLDGLNKGLLQQFGFELTFEGELDRKRLTSAVLVEAVKARVLAIFNGQTERYGDFFEHLKRIILLQTIDQRWKEHLQRVDQIKDGINLRAYAQKDPLVEYKQEAFKAFEEMDLAIKTETIEKLAKVQIVPQQGPPSSDDDDDDSEEDDVTEALPDATELPEMFGLKRPEDQRMQMSHQEVSSFGGTAPAAASAQGNGNASAQPRQYRSLNSAQPRPSGRPVSAPVGPSAPEVGRNDPCPCGSGKKYKKCHGAE